MKQHLWILNGLKLSINRKNIKMETLKIRWKIRNRTNLRNLKLGQGEELEKFGNDIESD